MMNLLTLLFTTIPILFWHGVNTEMAEEQMPVLAQTGADFYLCRYADCATTLRILDIAEKNGIKMFVGYPALIENPADECSKINAHPAFYGYYLKDEPELWDLDGLGEAVDRIKAADNQHPIYINLYPNWAWQIEKYADNIEEFANKCDVPFYSFDQYPVTQNADGSVSVRPDWYRNLEEFSTLARQKGKPFWAFALAESHFLGPPSPPAFYPVPTIGHLRLQVYSDLLYGAQVIQYYNFRGVWNKEGFHQDVFDIVKQMNSEIKALSPVFLGCSVQNVWHTGDAIPSHTKAFDKAYVSGLKKLEMSGNGAVVSLLTNGKNLYLAVQNRDCSESAMLEISFAKNIRLVSKDGSSSKGKTFEETVEPGDIRIFKLK